MVKKNIFLGIYVPAYDKKIYTDTARSLFDLSELLKLKKVPAAIIYSTGLSMIHDVRNRCFSNFIDGTDFTHMLFIDSDMAFKPQIIWNMLKFDAPVMGVAYARKFHSFELPRGYSVKSIREAKELCLTYNASFEELDINHSAEEVSKSRNINGFIKVARVATGMMLIRRDAAEKMVEAYPKDAYKITREMHPFVPKKYYGMFNPLATETNLLLGEDYSFCKRWTDIGGEIWCDIQSETSHHGSEVYTGSYLSTAALRKSRESV